VLNCESEKLRAELRQLNALLTWTRGKEDEAALLVQHRAVVSARFVANDALTGRASGDEGDKYGLGYALPVLAAAIAKLPSPLTSLT
jgi:hypothetical protein